ncbi:MAG: glycosyltransferase [Azospirillaceae bacterium]
MTVITPAYNRADLLSETIDSILGQDFNDYEYIVVDDGSTDGTDAVLRRYGTRLTVIGQNNQGEAAATNRGWRAARGDYIAVVSSDDPVRPGWLATAVAFMDAHPDVIVGYPDWCMIDRDSRPLMRIRTQDYSAERLVGWFQTMPGPGTLIRRRATLGERFLRDGRFPRTTDLECWLRLSLVGPFARIPGELATWRQHEGSITERPCSVAEALEFVRLARYFHRRRDLPPAIRALRRDSLSRAYWYASYKLKDSNPLRSALYLRRSYRLSPSGPADLPPILNRLPRPSLREVAWHLLRRPNLPGRGRALGSRRNA